MSLAVRIDDLDGYADEAELIEVWEQMVSEVAWEKGRLLSEYCQRYGESSIREAEFVHEVGGVSIADAKRLRRVYEAFAEYRDAYPNLLWVHYSAALEWEDREEWLGLANRRRYSVNRMRSARWSARQPNSPNRPR